MADEIKIELVADANGVIKAVQKVIPAAEKAGKKAADNIEKPLKSTGDRLKNSFAAIGAILGTALAGKKFIDAAAEQERVVEKLNASLRNMGAFTQETSKSLQDFAANLEMTTTFGDEVILDQLAFAQAMGASVKQSKEIIKVSMELARAQNIDLNSAVRNVTKTLGGYAGELGESIPALKSLSAEQLKAGAGIDLLASKYKGFTEAELNTFNGAMLFLQNALGTASEKIGEAIVKSPVLIKAIRLIGEGIQKTFGKFPVGALIKGLDSLIITIADTADAFSVLVTPIIKIIKIFDTLFEGAKTGFQTIVVVATNAFAQLAETIPSALLPDGFAENTRMAADSAREVLNQMQADTKQTFDSIFEDDTAFSDSIRQRISNFSSSLQETLALSNEALEQQAENGNKAQKKVTTIYDSLIKKQADFAKQTKIALVQNAAGAFSQGFNAMGAAVANGANVFEAGMNSILGSFGSALSQLGQGYFLQGLAMLFAGQPGGGALMAQGAALTTFGGFLSAKFGGGAGSAPAATGGANATGAATDPLTGAVPVEDIASDEPEEIERQQQVQLVVQGDVLDSEETGTRLLNILNEQFDNKGGRIAYA